MASKRAVIWLILASVFILAACNFNNPDDSPGMIGCDTIELVNAIEMANNTKEQVAINLAANCLYEFSEAYSGDLSRPLTALPLIASPIVIHGNGAKLQIKYESQVLTRLVYIAENGRLTINNLILRGSDYEMYFFREDAIGGLVYNKGTLEINNSSLMDGVAYKGGAIENIGTLAIRGSILENSISYAWRWIHYGGCVDNVGGDINIQESSFISCGAGEGGAILNQLGRVQIQESEFINCTAYSDGGAIYSEHVIEGALIIADTVFVGNSSPHEGSGGAVSAKGPLSITGSTFQSNTTGGPGGALYHYGGDLQIQNTSFVTNSASIGGAIYHNGTYSHNNPGSSLNLISNGFIMNQALGHGGAIFLTVPDPASEILLENNTISQNVGESAIYNSGPILLRFNTLANNDAIGIYSKPKLTETVIENTIITNNLIDCDIQMNLISQGMNINNDGSCSGFPINADPLLEPLANNGGPTLTHALPANSPAVDAAAGNCPATDQRGEARPGGNGCDLGAYESGEASLAGPAFGDVPAIDTSDDPDLGPPPDLDICVARVEILVPCNEGPGDQYPTVSSLKPDGVIEVTGQSINGDYAVVRNPCFPELGCWVRKSFLIFYCDDGLLPLMSTPALEKPEPDKSSGGPPACSSTLPTQVECEAAGGTWVGGASGAPCACG